MPGNTENVTTKFKVDISDLKANITAANKQIQLANAQFKNATAGMDDWRKSADGLSAKIQQQNAIVEQEKIKLQALKDQLARLNESQQKGEQIIADLTRKHAEAAAQFGEDSDEAKKYAKQLLEAEKAQQRNSDAAESLKIQIINQDTAVKNAAAQVDKFSDSLDGLQEEEKETDEEAEKTTNGGIQAFSVALGNLASNVIQGVINKLVEMGKVAVDAFEQFDAGRDALIKSTGATGEAADQLTATFSNVAKSVSGNLEDIGAAVGEVNTRFGYTGDELSRVSEDFMKFSDITGVDAVAAVQGISKALAGAGLPAEEYAQLMDKVSAASQASGISAQTLLDGLSKYGAQMRAIGYDTDDTIALLSQFEKSGVNADTALTGLRKATANWTKDGKNAKTELQALIKEIKETQDSTAAAGAAVDVFGSKAGTELAEAIRSGRFEFEDFSKVVANSSGTVGRTFDETQSGIDKIKLAAQGLSVTFGEAAGKLVEQFAPGIENIIKLFTKVISGDDEAEDELADSIGEFVENALNKAVSALPGAVGFVSRIFGKLVQSIAEAAPGAVKAVGAVVKTIIYGFTGFLPTLIDSILMAIPEVEKALLEAAPEIIKAVLTLAERVAIKIPEALVKIVEYLPALVQGVSDFLIEQTPIIIQSAISMFTGLVQALPTVMQSLVDVLPILLKTVTEFISSNAPMILQAVLDIVTALIQAVPEIAKAIYPMIPQIMDTLVEAVVNFVPVWIDTFKRMFQMLASAIPGIWENVEQAFSKVFELWKTNIFDRARDAFGEIWNHIKDTVAPVGKKIGDAIGGAFKTTINAAIETVERALNAIPNAINKALDAINSLPGVNIAKLPEVVLPRLARGGIINKPTVAAIGEDGTEAVLPLEKNKQGLKQIAAALADEMKVGALSRIGTGSQATAGTNVNMVQNITSPKALSAYEVWRQTQNMLNLIKVQGV